MNRLLYYFLVTIGAGLVLYLSWRSHPSMGHVWFIPHSVARWADKQENDTIRTAVPLVALGLIVGGQLAWQRRPWWQWPVAWVLLFALVVLAEAGQHFRAYRRFDLADVAWGGVGAAIGLALIAILPAGYWLLRRASSLRQTA
jgi:hypothetical protein